MNNLAAFVIVLFVVSCGSNATERSDASALPQECLPVDTPLGFVYPAGPYGIDVGGVFEDFTLEDCDGNPVSFGDILSEAELVLFNVGAGWCQPCIEETQVIEAELHAPFCARGLRIVQVLFQDEESRAATKFFCQQWRDRYGLRFPVLVDPLFTTAKYFEAAQTPLNLLVDKNGNIVFRSVGVAPADLDARIDTLLP